MRDNNTTLEEAENNQREIKSNQKETGKGLHEPKEQKSALKNVKVFYEAHDKFIKYLIIFLQCHMWLNIHQFMEKDLKY